MSNSQITVYLIAPVGLDTMDNDDKVIVLYVCFSV